MDKTKVMYGLATIDFKDDTPASLYSISAVKKDSIQISVTAQDTELEDGTMVTDFLKMEAVLTVSEVDMAQWTDLPTDTATVDVTFAGSGKVMTLTPSHVKAELEGNKAKFTITGVGSVISDVLTVA